MTLKAKTQVRYRDPRTGATMRGVIRCRDEFPGRWRVRPPCGTEVSVHERDITPLPAA